MIDMAFCLGQRVTFKNDDGSPRSGRVDCVLINDEGDDDALIEVKCDDNGRIAVVFTSMCELESPE